jgi:amino acid adenylation domain-containing protein
MTVSIEQFILDLRNEDIFVSAESGRLRISAPKGALKPELKKELGQRKSELLAFLNRVQGRGVSAGPELKSVARDRPLPLSFGQQRLWILDQLGADSAYHISLAVNLKGLLNVTALEKSFSELVKRHETLRTTFPTVQGQPVQVIAPEHKFDLPLVELNDLSKAEREARARRLAEEEAQRPFDLSEGPLIRAALLRLSEEDHILLLTMHHIVSDGWSMGVFTRELAALYESFSEGIPSPLPELPIQYADFAHWQREWLQGKVLENQLSYWRKQLDGISVLQLPTDRPRPAAQTFQGSRQTFVISASVTDALNVLSQREGVTLFMTLLAAFQTLLYRYTGQDDIVVGSPIANRNRTEIEGIIGFFVNSLAMRTHLSGNPSFRELLGRVREVAWVNYAHQDLPFEKLVEELQPERDLSQNPIFQVMLALLNTPPAALKLPGLTISPLDTDLTLTRFDMEFHLWEKPDGISGFLLYNIDLFDASTISRMMGHYETLLKGIVANPEQRISDLPLLTEAERQQLHMELNDTHTDYPRDYSIHELFEDRVDRNPDAIAVVFGDQKLTYRELNYRANQLAHYLKKCGVDPDVLVGLFMERSVEMVVGLLGILKAGGAYVPLDLEYPKDRLAFMLADAEVPVLLTQERLVKGLPAHRARVVCLNSEWEAICKESQANLPSSTTAENLAYVNYTSGSTGKPKGICIPHRAVNRLVFNTNYVKLTPSDRVAQASNCSFDAATFEIWGALLQGARLVGITKDVMLLPGVFAAQIRDQEISALFLTTALFNQLAQEVPGAFQSVRHLLFGGEAVDPRWVREVLNHDPPERLLHVYGPTESTTFASWQMIERVAEGATTVPIGSPIANTKLYVLDRHFNLVPIGVPGELYIGGDGLARNYLNRAELTAEKFIPNPFSEEPGGRLYKTGDLVRHLADGSIEFLGRLDQQVKLRGFRIELGEIEAVLGQHPAVRDTVILAREDVLGDKRLVAWCLQPSFFWTLCH